MEWYDTLNNFGMRESVKKLFYFVVIFYIFSKCNNIEYQTEQK